MIAGFVLYAIMWWTVIFAILPFGNKPPENITTGHAGSAPAQPRLLKKIIATTIVTTLLWWPAHMAVQYSMDQARESARQMEEDDNIKYGMTSEPEGKSSPQPAQSRP